MKKKIFAVILTVCMIMTMIPMNAFAEQQEKKLVPVFSTIENLDTADISKIQDFGIIGDLAVSGQPKDFTGYLYIATEGSNGNYTKFEKLPDRAVPYITYSVGEKNWSEANDLSYAKNDDGSYTFKYLGKIKDTNIKKNKNGYIGYAIALKQGTTYIADDSIYIDYKEFNVAKPDENKEYSISFEMLRDPEDCKGNLYGRPTDRMWVNGQGFEMVFNSKITEWYTSFYVIDRTTMRDARGVVNENGQEERFYIGAKDDFVIQVKETWEPSQAWKEQTEANKLFEIEYLGYRKQFNSVYKIKMTGTYDSKYQYRLVYNGTDEYLDTGKAYKYLTLSVIEDMADFDIDESVYDEQNDKYNPGNVQYFDYIGASINTKLNIRPGNLTSVANKIVCNPDEFIYIEDEAENIKFYRYSYDGEGMKRLVPLEKEASPFTVKWDPEKKWYNIVYDHPEKDIYGPMYAMIYSGDYNTKINKKYGSSEDTEYTVKNQSIFFTGKFTVNADLTDGGNVVDATIEDNNRDRINTIGIIFGKGSINGKAEISIKANEGNITIGGSLVGNMGDKSGNVSFEMRDLLKDDYGLSDAQKEFIEKCRKAFDFKITDEDQKDIAFGDDGYAEIEIPCDIQGMAIYYIDENGNKTLISSTYENGKLKFTAKHFSTYVVAPYENTGGSTSGGGTVMPPAADEDDVKTTTDNTTSEIKTSTTIKDTKTETVKNEQGQEISKVTAKVSEKTANNLVDAAVSNKSDTVEITVKSSDGNKAEQTEVEIPKKALESIAKDTEADLVIKTDNGQVILDNRTLETIAAEAEGDTVRLVVNENAQLKEEQKPASDVIGDNGKLFDLKAVIGDKILHDFRGGKAHVTLPMPEKLKGKDVVVIYINDKGICEILNHTMETIGAEKYIKFTTSHFSNFAVVEKADAEKIIDKQNADKINSLIREAEFKATTSNTSKKNVRVKIREAKSSNSLIKEAKAMGYTVKYKYYRSAKKSSKYKAVKTKTSNSFINTKGKKGIKYYYKAKVLVYDGKKLVAQTELKQCSYGARTWNK